MDFIKKAAEELQGKNTGTTTNTNNAAPGGSDTANTAPAGGQPGQPAQGGQDYGDKAFAFGSKKAGYNVDPNTQEKITDGARGAYEKFSGSKVDSKYSN